MALKSVYLPQPSIRAGIIEITEDEHRHLMVARAGPGELLEVFDGKGHVWTATVLEAGKRRLLARVQSEHEVPPPAEELILGQAVIRPAAFEAALEKAVEVGVTRIIPFTAARSNVVWSPRQDRLQRVMVEAAKQSKRFHLPVLEQLMKFDQLLGVAATSRILFAERAGISLKSAVAGAPVLYLVGPEGGWTDEELQSARASGFKEVTLGSGILRSETAAVIGAALIRYELSLRSNP